MAFLIEPGLTQGVDHPLLCGAGGDWGQCECTKRRNVEMNRPRAAAARRSANAGFHGSLATGNMTRVAYDVRVTVLRD